MDPRGATEIQMEMLHKYVDKDILNQVQICTSIPGKVPIDPNKVNILSFLTYFLYKILIILELNLKFFGFPLNRMSK